MIEIRCVRPNEMIEAAELADAVFERKGKSSMSAAFPMIFSSSPGQSFGTFDQGKLVSFMGLVPSTIRIGATKLQVYSLGCVCTHPDYQGKGYASQMLEQVMLHVDHSGASLLLVSGGRSLYERANCYPFGAAERFTLREDIGKVGIEQLKSACSEGLSIRKQDAADWFHMQRLARDRVCSYEQSVWDMAKLVEAEALASCYNMRQHVYVAEREGHMVAFAVVAVPESDSRHSPMVMEWAGQTEAMYTLLYGVMQDRNLQELSIVLPWDELAFRKLLTNYGLVGKLEKNGGTVKIMSGSLLLEQLYPYLADKNVSLLSRLQIEWLNDGGCVVSLDGSTAHLGPREAVSLMFDSEQDLLADLEPKLRQALAELFPIPLPYTRGLNYV